MKNNKNINRNSTIFKRVKRRVLRARFLAVGVIIILLALEFALQVNASNRNAKSTANIIMNQVTSLITDAEIEQANLIREIKGEYLTQARALAYVLDASELSTFSTAFLREKRELISVDEINIFDENGVITSSTEPRYIGYSMEDGEQIGYFKPMLNDKSLSLSQDITPNTASNINIMYTAVWNQEGTYIVQVGIVPKRLLSYMRETEVSKIINDIPRYEGYTIYVADKNTGIIRGATNTTYLGEELEKVGLNNNITEGEEFKRIGIGSFFCKYKETDKYSIIIMSDMNVFYAKVMESFTIVLLYLLVAGFIVMTILKKLLITSEDRNSQLSVLRSMSEIYYSMHYVDLVNNTVYQYTGVDEVDKQMRNTDGKNATIMMRNIMEETLAEEYMDEGMEFTDITTIAQRMKGKKLLTKDMISNNIGWFRMCFITIEADENDVPTALAVTTQNIDEEKKREFELFEKSNKDALTLCLNRRSFEEDIASHNNVPKEDDFAIIVFDMNGVKKINDILGHDAGDEAIRAAAEIMRNTFGKYGAVYRMGGDEFLSIVFANEERLARLKTEFDDHVSRWHGVKADSISISYGIATKKEYPDKSVSELIKIADESMYDIKRAYYATKGNDRRRSSR